MEAPSLNFNCTVSIENLYFFYGQQVGNYIKITLLSQAGKRKDAR
jgi:hypothetical protein